MKLFNIIGVLLALPFLFAAIIITVLGLMFDVQTFVNTGVGIIATFVVSFAIYQKVTSKDDNRN